MARQLSRRQALLAGSGVAISAILAACSAPAAAPPTAAPASAPAAAPTVAPSAATAAPTAVPAAQATTAPAPTAAANPAVTPTTQAASAPQVPAVPREQTLVFSVSDSLNQMNDATIANPFLLGAQRTGWQFAFEPLYFYNCWWTDAVSGPPGLPGKAGEIPYLATSYQYNDTSDAITIKLRPNVTWSDGQPFTANDVAFTINMLKDNAPKLNFSNDMKLWIKDVTAVDNLTLQMTLTSPNPRFFFEYFQWFLDHGFPFVPEHIFKGQDPLTFTNLDLAKGWPVTTGPWKLVYSDPLQKIYDRRDDWWGAKTGFHPLPKMKRVVVLPRYDDPKIAQLLISNQIDAGHQLQPADASTVMKQNPKIIVRTLDQSHPWGWIASWPQYIGFNDSEPPWNDPDLRWAVNHAIDRKQIVDIGFQGDNEIATLPLETNAALDPYFKAVSDILQRYPIDDFDIQKTAQILQSKGYQKDQGGFWAKDGKRLPMLITTPAGFFQNYTPIVVAQLRKAGFDAAFKSPADAGTLEQEGQLNAYIDGQQGSVRDPYLSMEQFRSRYSAPTGQPAQYPFRWKNPTYDKLVDELQPLPASDPKFMNIYHQMMELWIPALPTIPLVQDFVIVPVNTTYWTGWPTDKSPYTLPGFWLRGSAGLVINSLQPAT
jgi:peptide/nickel transport system substrate-binding protein